MVRLLVGKKGSGKTKAMIDSINAAKNSEHGDIVFICSGDRHNTDISHSIRLIDMTEYSVDTYETFLCFIQGILSQNYDITHIYIDSLLKITKNGVEPITDFINKLSQISEKGGISFTISISADKSELPEGIYGYIC